MSNEEFMIFKNAYLSYSRNQIISNKKVKKEEENNFWKYIDIKDMID